MAHSEFPHDSGTLVHRLFEGTLTSETRCLTCETVGHPSISFIISALALGGSPARELADAGLAKVSSRDESFLDLSIDIEQNSSVTACLRQFSASEMLCQRNKFFCDSCCGLQEAEKRYVVSSMPSPLSNTYDIVAE